MLALLVTFLLISGVSAVNPGAKIRISQSGFNYGASVAVDILTEAVKKLSIPDAHGQAHTAVGKVEYDVQNMKVLDFSKPSTAVAVRPGGGLTWKVSNAGVSMRGDWRYKYRIGFVKFRDHGSFEGSASGVSVSISVQLSADGSGHPSIRSTACSATVGNLNVRVHGGASWLYNLFIKEIVRPIRSSLEKLICKEAQAAVNVNAERELATLPVQALIDHQWILDYRLVTPPLSAAGFLESAHKGEFFRKGDSTEAPFQPDVMPEPATTSPRMITISLSDYVLNSAGYVFYKRGILRYNLTAADLPPAERGYLDTTCSAKIFFCFGRLVPAVGKSRPNASVEMEMSVTAPPNATVDARGLEGRMSGEIVHRARLVDGSSAYLFRTAVSVVFSLTAELHSAANGVNITANITKLTPTVRVIDSAVGPISGQALTAVFGIAAKTFIVPKLNEVGAKGFPLPMIDHVKLVNVELTQGKHALYLATDIHYSP